MANIKRFLEKGEKQKKTKTKSFRLSEKAFTLLENLSETTQNSQNEIINDILEEYEKELTYVEMLKMVLLGLAKTESAGVVLEKLHKGLNVRSIYIIRFTDEPENYSADFKIFKDVFSGKGKEIYSESFTFSNVVNLLDYGVNSGYILNMK